MTFPVHVIYLLKGYTYDVETTDGLHFSCRRRPSPHAEDYGAPPEQIELVKEETPKRYEFGEYKVQLHTDLLAGIEDFLRKGA